MAEQETFGDGSLLLRRRRSGFALIPNELISDTRISIETRGLMVYLLSCADGWRFNVAQVAKVCGVGRDKLRRMMTEAKDHGYLEYKPVRSDGGRMGGWAWMVDASPDRVPENPSLGSTECRKIPPHKNTIQKEDQLKEPTAPSSPDLFAGAEGDQGREEPEKEKIQKDPQAPSALDEAFSRFWAAYPTGPRKTDKPKARAAFVAICTGKAKGIPKTDPETIITGARAYAATEPGEFLKMPTGWLNGARWESVQAPSALPQGPAQSDIDLAMQFVPELRGKDTSCLPLPLWNKLEHVKMVAKSLRAAGMPLPWSQDAQRPTERPAGGDKAHRLCQGSQLGQYPASGALRGSAHG